MTAALNDAWQRFCVREPAPRFGGEHTSLSEEQLQSAIERLSSPITDYNSRQMIDRPAVMRIPSSVIFTHMSTSMHIWQCMPVKAKNKYTYTHIQHTLTCRHTHTHTLLHTLTFHILMYVKTYHFLKSLSIIRVPSHTTCLLCENS